jgi:hypothetical protein
MSLQALFVVIACSPLVKTFDRRSAEDLPEATELLLHEFRNVQNIENAVIS